MQHFPVSNSSLIELFKSLKSHAPWNIFKKIPHLVKYVIYSTTNIMILIDVLYFGLSNAFNSHRSEIQISIFPNRKSHMIGGMKLLSSSAPDLLVMVLPKSLCMVLCNRGASFQH